MDEHLLDILIFVKYNWTMNNISAIEFTSRQQFAIDFGHYLGGGTLLILLAFSFFVYYFVTSKFSTKDNLLKFLAILDVIFGILFPFIGLYLIMPLENYYADMYKVSGLVNSPHGYTILILSSILFGIFSICKKRKALGLGLIIIPVISIIVVSFLSRPQ